ncbi:TPA: NAD-dependent epimerase/dehydratase family protein [Vibrio vulnificus]|nr:NAD-dependent epimerase/dehydratase family protein [Vibrio vulnificus]
MSKKVLITGGAGFTGVILKEYLRSNGYTVFTTSLKPSCDELFLDICDKQSILGCLNRIRPNYIVHLAAISFVGHSNELDFYNVNVIGTSNLLEVIVESKIKTEKVLISSSANVYGNVKGKISEANLPSPENNYALSKYCMEKVALGYKELPIVIVRPFNYTGYGQSEKFLIPKIVKHFAEKQSSIQLGNINVARDFSDVRDIVRYYVELMESKESKGIYNLCSGKETSIIEIIKLMESISNHKMDVVINKSLVRCNEIDRLFGDNSRLKKVIGKFDVIDIYETLSWIYESYCSELN